MIVITIATTPSVSALRRVGVMQDPPWGNMTPPGSGSSLAGEHECGSAREAGEGADVAPADRFLEHYSGEDGKHREGNDFLRDLQLAAGEAVSVADPVRGHGKAIFDQCDPPADQNGRDHRQVGEFQMAIPGDGHENVRDDEERYGDHGGAAYPCAATRSMLAGRALGRINRCLLPDPPDQFVELDGLLGCDEGIGGRKFVFAGGFSSSAGGNGYTGH